MSDSPGQDAKALELLRAAHALLEFAARLFFAFAVRDVATHCEVALLAVCPLIDESKDLEPEPVSVAMSM